MHQLSVDPIALLDCLEKLFKESASYIMRQAGSGIAVTHKADNSPVTEVDQVIEARVLHGIAERFPDLQVFGEETGYTVSQLPSQYVLIDPIDGTDSFITGTPAFTCMAVYVVDDEAVASIIFNASSGDCYRAIQGSGAYKNNCKLWLPDLALPEIVYAKGRFVTTLNLLLSPIGKRAEIGPTGAGYGFSMVAEGSIAARCQLRSRGYLHDYATGALLVREAGGCIVPVLDKKYSIHSKSFIACHPELETFFVSHMEELLRFESEEFSDRSIIGSI